MQLTVHPFERYAISRQYHLSAADALSAPTGRVTVIRGDSGAGKSTLLEILAGYRPVQDLRITVQADETAAAIPLRDFQREANRVAYLPQQSVLRPELHPATALENWHALLTASYPEDSPITLSVRETQQALLEKLFTPEEKEHLFGPDAPRIKQLSGGQQRRLDVVLTLSSPAEIILLDEPDSGLDPERRNILFDVLSEHTASQNKILIMVSHYAADELDSEKIDSWLTERQARGKGGSFRPEHHHPAGQSLDPHPAPEERGNRMLDQFFRYLRQGITQLRSGLSLLYLIAPIVFLLLVRFAVHPIPEGESGYQGQARSLMFFFAVTCYWLGAVQSTGFWVTDRVWFFRECRQDVSPLSYLMGFLSVFAVLCCIEAALATLVLLPGSGLQLGAGWVWIFGCSAAINGLVGGLFWSTLQHRLLPNKTGPGTAQLIALLLTLSAIVFSYPVVQERPYQDFLGKASPYSVSDANRLGLLKAMSHGDSLTDRRYPSVALAELPIAANPAFHGLWFQGEMPLHASFTKYDQSRRMAVNELLANALLLLGCTIGSTLLARKMAALR